MTTRYRHDGQMGIEDAEAPFGGGATTVTRYGLGARGVDMIERTAGSTVTTGFPVYDAHGNNVATLSRNGSGGYNVADRRSYDAWGVVRSQQSAGDPKLRYCASLGHRQDDESGLVYMRARYYEPTSGRFVSEDPSRHGSNWFSYCSNNPVNATDPSGREAVPVWRYGIFGLGIAFAIGACYQINKGNSFGPTYDSFASVAYGKASGMAAIATACFAIAAIGLPDGHWLTNDQAAILGAALSAVQGLLTVMTAGARAASRSAAGIAVVGAFAYGLIILGELIAQEVDNG